MIEHGGRLREAAAHYAIALHEWLDLSTGINPHGWPVPALPMAAWARLPEEGDGLEEAARDYYGAPHVLPVAGSQAALQALPRLRSPSRVGVLHPGYLEHGHWWRRAGHEVRLLGPQQMHQRSRPFDVLVLSNPNNPTGCRFELELLFEWHSRLAAGGGWLVVDEAFIDATPGASLAPFSQRPGLIVLRSLGKFFGLAGARVGFVLAAAKLLSALREQLGPWTVAGPSRWVAQQALEDRRWQADTRERLMDASRRLSGSLARHGLKPSGNTALFQWVRTRDASTIQDALARRGIWVRLFDDPASVRFGLPGSEGAWQRLEKALAAVAKTQTDAVSP